MQAQSMPIIWKSRKFLSVRYAAMMLPLMQYPLNSPFLPIVLTIKKWDIC